MEENNEDVNGYIYPWISQIQGCLIEQQFYSLA